jgi:hypothetical protein
VKTCAAILVLACAAPAQAPLNAIRTTVCAVVASPRTYSGKVISITGRVESDGTHGSMVVDDRCIELGIGLTAHNRYRGEETLASALGRRYPGTIDKTINAIVIGTFKWNPKEDPPRVLVLELQEVRDVSVVMKGAQRP